MDRNGRVIESYTKLVDKFIFEGHSSTSVLYKLANGQNFNNFQKLSLLRLIWAVESINKIKYSIVYNKTTVIFLDNLDFQVRMSLTPIYATKFNVDTLVLFDQAPEFTERLKTFGFFINLRYEVTQEDGEFSASYKITRRDLNNTNTIEDYDDEEDYYYDITITTLLARNRYSFTNQYELYQTLFLPLIKNQDESSQMNAE
jgi:hypothetical protein